MVEPDLGAVQLAGLPTLGRDVTWYGRVPGRLLLARPSAISCGDHQRIV